MNTLKLVREDGRSYFFTSYRSSDTKYCVDIIWGRYGKAYGCKAYAFDYPHLAENWLAKRLQHKLKEGYTVYFNFSDLHYV